MVKQQDIHFSGFELSIRDFEVLDTASVAPEPSTYALMLGGLGLVGFMAFRRKS